MLLRWEINGGGQAFLRPLPASIPTPQGFRYEDLFFAPTADEGRAWEARDVFQDLAVIAAVTTLWWAAAIGSAFGQPEISTYNLHTR